MSFWTYSNLEELVKSKVLGDSEFWERFYFCDWIEKPAVVTLQLFEIKNGNLKPTELVAIKEDDYEPWYENQDLFFAAVERFFRPLLTFQVEYQEYLDTHYYLYGHNKSKDHLTYTYYLGDFLKWLLQLTLCRNRLIQHPYHKYFERSVIHWIACKLSSKDFFKLAQLLTKGESIEFLRIQGQLTGDTFEFFENGERDYAKLKTILRNEGVSSHFNLWQKLEKNWRQYENLAPNLDDFNIMLKEQEIEFRSLFKNLFSNITNPFGSKLTGEHKFTRDLNLSITEIIWLYHASEIESLPFDVRVHVNDNDEYYDIPIKMTVNPLGSFSGAVLSKYINKEDKEWLISLLNAVEVVNKKFKLYLSHIDGNPFEEIFFNDQMYPESIFNDIQELFSENFKFKEVQQNSAIKGFHNDGLFLIKPVMTVLKENELLFPFLFNQLYNRLNLATKDLELMEVLFKNNPVINNERSFGIERLSNKVIDFEKKKSGYLQGKRCPPWLKEPIIWDHLRT